MKPIKFPEQNVVYAKDQKEYLPLPAHRTEDGQVITCWQLDEKELEQIQQTGCIWLRIHTFNMPLHPMSAGVEKPFEPVVEPAPQSEDVERCSAPFPKSKDPEPGWVYCDCEQPHINTERDFHFCLKCKKPWHAELCKPAVHTNPKCKFCETTATYYECLAVGGNEGPIVHFCDEHLPMQF